MSDKVYYDNFAGFFMVIAEKWPKGTAWQRLVVPESVVLVGGDDASAWRSGLLGVISQVADMDLPDESGEHGPTWHVSVSSRAGRVTDDDMLRVRRAFDMLDAEEDNHEPGKARHLFLVVDPARRVPCPCKDEDTFVEPNGHRWATKRGTADERRALMRAIHG